MRWIILGVLIGLVIVFPSLLALLALLGALAAAILSKPLLVAFGLGLAARPHLPAVRRWTA